MGPADDEPHTELLFLGLRDYAGALESPGPRVERPKARRPWHFPELLTEHARALLGPVRPLGCHQLQGRHRTCPGLSAALCADAALAVGADPRKGTTRYEIVYKRTFMILMKRPSYIKT